MGDQMGKDLETVQAGVIDPLSEDETAAITKTLFGFETTKGEVKIGKEGQQVIPSAIWLNSARIIPLDAKHDSLCWTVQIRVVKGHRSFCLLLCC